MTAVIRPATKEDMRQIVDLWHDGWHEAHHHIVPEPVLAYRTSAHFELWLAQCAGTFSVAVLNSVIAGFYCVDGLEISKLYVHSNARGTGVAPALLCDAEHKLLDQGVREAHLYCTTGNTRAGRFYSRHGWQCLSTSADHLWLPSGVAGRYLTGTDHYTKVLTAS